ncbi:MAG: carotenoid biosynthesis protein, partial [Pedosphaera parvula]|nr:carotenoid biosynthesis protein [Pedosphaera parvula]
MPEQHTSTSARSSQRHDRGTPARRRITALVMVLFSVCWTASLLAVISRNPGLAWLEGGLLITGTAATLIVSSRRLPAQNVVAVAALIGLGAALITFLSDRTGIPFGSRTCTERFGGVGFSILPWPIPLLWICVLLNSRAVARLILRPWRRTGHYGVWLIALAAALAVAI